MKTSHIVSFASAFGLAVASIVFSVLLYGSLPGQIPTHFGFAGTPDAWASKDLVMVFMVPVLQLLFFCLFLLLYRHPQYMSWPTTMLLMTVEVEKREKIFAVLKSMMAGMLVTISLLFTYIQFTIFATANNRLQGLNPYVMIAFVGLIFAALIFYNAKIFVLVRKLTKVNSKS